VSSASQARCRASQEALLSVFPRGQASRKKTCYLVLAESSVTPRTNTICLEHPLVIPSPYSIDVNMELASHLAGC